jgi:hypothetical protein
MEQARSSGLRSAARIADALVYTTGLAGVLAGGLLLRRGDLGFAIVAWSLTFVAGAALRLAAEMGRALADMLLRQARLEDDVAALRTAAGSPHRPPW